MLWNDCFCFRGGYFPASGYRNYTYGDFGRLAEGGYLWSSSSFGIDSWRACFLGTVSLEYLEPFRADGRSWALPVRCVQELTKYFVSNLLKCHFKPGVLMDSFVLDRVAYKFKQSGRQHDVASQLVCAMFA